VRISFALAFIFIGYGHELYAEDFQYCLSETNLPSETIWTNVTKPTLEGDWGAEVLAVVGFDQSTYWAMKHGVSNLVL
jgi:hypothetical protein